MQSNMSNKLLRRRIPTMDIVSRYRMFSGLRLQATDVKSQKFDYQPSIPLYRAEIEGIAFMVAYLLVLVIRVSLLICAVFAMLTQLYHFSLVWPTRIYQ